MLSLSRLPRKPAPNRTGLQRRGPGCTHRARLRRRWSKQEVISRATPQLGRYPHCPSDRTRTTTTTSALLVWEPNRPGSCEIFGLRSCGLAGCWIRDRLRVTPTKDGESKSRCARPASRERATGPSASRLLITWRASTLFRILISEGGESSYVHVPKKTTVARQPGVEQ